MFTLVFQLHLIVDIVAPGITKEAMVENLLNGGPVHGCHRSQRILEDRIAGMILVECIDEVFCHISRAIVSERRTDCDCERTDAGQSASHAPLTVRVQCGVEPFTQPAVIPGRAKAMAALIRPDEPLFYFRFVQRNEAIKKALIKIDNDQRLQAEVRTLSTAVTSGNWDHPILSHTDIKSRFPNEQPEIHIKDIAFYAYWNGEISRHDFHTVISKLNLAEQFGMEIPSRYTRGKEEFDLPRLEGDIRTLRLFDENKNVTPEGECYFAVLEDTADSFTKTFNREKFVERLRQMPANMQVVFDVQNIDEDKVESTDGLKWAFRQYGNEWVDPLFFERQHEGILCFTSPSYGVMYEFMAQCTLLPTQKAIVQPVMCLGSSGSDMERELHANGWHQVVAYDTRVKSNMVDIHNRRPGVYLGERHDSVFHPLYASVLSPMNRKLLCTVMPDWLSEIVHESPELAEPAEKLKAALVDLTIRDERNGKALERFVYVSASKLLSNQEKRSSGNQPGIYQEERARYLDLLVKFDQKLKAGVSSASNLPAYLREFLSDSSLPVTSWIKEQGEKFVAARLENHDPLSERDMSLLKTFFPEDCELSENVRRLMEAHPDAKAKGALTGSDTIRAI